MRVYGSVMWSLGKALKGVPEVPKLFVGSFWDAEMPVDDGDDGNDEDEEIVGILRDEHGTPRMRNDMDDDDEEEDQGCLVDGQ